MLFVSSGGDRGRGEVVWGRGEGGWGLMVGAVDGAVYGALNGAGVGETRNEEGI